MTNLGLSVQVWTDADLATLARLMKKFPGGTLDRWEKIAEAMERLPWEITKMAKRVKDIGFQVTTTLFRSPSRLFWPFGLQIHLDIQSKILIGYKYLCIQYTQ